MTLSLFVNSSHVITLTDKRHFLVTEFVHQTSVMFSLFLSTKSSSSLFYFNFYVRSMFDDTRLRVARHTLPPWTVDIIPHSIQPYHLLLSSFPPPPPSTYIIIALLPTLHSAPLLASHSNTFLVRSLKFPPPPLCCSPYSFIFLSCKLCNSAHQS